MKTGVRPQKSMRGARVAFKRAAQVKAARRRVVVVRAQENIFQQLGTTLVKAGSQLVGNLTGTSVVRKAGKQDDKVVFVAGATGRVGARIVLECIQAGFTVRAGVRSVEKGQDLIDMAKETLSARDASRIKLVEYDLFDADTIPSAIGNAGLVVCAIGAPESKPFDVSGPRKVDGEAAIALVKAATDAGVSQFVMITSLGTTKFGWPASALNLFWGVLSYKKQAEQALQSSGMAYTIIRPGGMERPKDDYKETHNVVLAPRDTFFGGQVSRIQVAELTAACLASRELSENKVLEVVAETDAPAESYEALLEEVPQEISMEDMRERRALIQDARNKAALLAQELEELEAELAAAEERKIVAENEFAEARTTLQAVTKESREAISEAERSEQAVARIESALEAARVDERAAKAVVDAQRRAARSGELLSARDIKDIRASVQPAEAAPARGGFSLFGGGGQRAKEVVEEVEEEVEEAAQPVKRGLFSFFGKAKEAVDTEEVEEVVEEVEEEVVKPAKRGLFSLFGQAKEAVNADEVEEQVAQVSRGAQRNVGKAANAAKSAAAEVDEEVVKPAKRGLFSLFGQAKDAVDADEVEEQAQRVQQVARGAAREAGKAAEEVVKPVQRGAGRAALAAKQAVEDVSEKVEDKVEEVKTQKGGGLFGFLQQDTVYADEAEPAAPPSEEAVRRAVTKRGTGPGPRRRSAPKREEVEAKVEEAAAAVQGKAKEVAAAVDQGKVGDAAKAVQNKAKEAAAAVDQGKVGDAAKAVQNKAKEAAASVDQGKAGDAAKAVQGKAKEVAAVVEKRAEKVQAAAAPAVEDAAEAAKEGAQQAGNFFGGFFNNLMNGGAKAESEEAAAPAPAAAPKAAEAPAPKPVAAAKPAPAPKPVAEAKPAPKPAAPAAPSPAKEEKDEKVEHSGSNNNKASRENAVQAALSNMGVSEEKAPQDKAPKKAPAKQAAAPADKAAEARAWIANWRAKSKVTVKV